MSKYYHLLEILNITLSVEYLEYCFTGGGQDRIILYELVKIGYTEIKTTQSTSFGLFQERRV